MGTIRRLLRIMLTMPAPYRRRLFGIQIGTIFAAAFELCGVSSVMPFLLVVSAPEKLLAYPLAVRVFDFFGCTTPESMIWLTGTGSVLIFISLNIARLWLRHYTLTFSASCESYLCARLFRNYLERDYLFHTRNNSAKLGGIVFNEMRTVCLAIQNMLVMFGSLALALALGLFLFAVSPVMSVACGGILAAVYLGIYKMMRPKILACSRDSTSYFLRFSQEVNEGLCGIVDVKLAGREAEWERRVGASRLRNATGQAMIGYYSVFPRYVIESAFFLTVVGVVIVLVRFEGGLTGALPVLTLYAMGTFRMLPAVQGVFTCFTILKGAVASLDMVETDLMESLRRRDDAKGNANAAGTGEPAQPLLAFEQSVELTQVRFSYPGKERPALDGISLRIPKNATIGLAGPSGSGKSTALGIMLGLLFPDAGQMRVDGVTLEGARLRDWQRKIGYVPQSIFLADASIEENIAFGAPLEEGRLCAALELAELDGFVSGLPQGLQTVVGERGVQLSGGQRQRIGIARALYHDPEVVIFDEATSALDGITEQAIMAAVRRLASRKTVIMVAHRLTTLKDCETIFFLENGRVADAGTYDELMRRNDAFQKMSRLGHTPETGDADR